ncbi:hypothetical protein DXG01_015499 [Tephrocybe rancida]|nr:hypothetical protein DXG01_015499 [Tephrocybe rancida]
MAPPTGPKKTSPSSSPPDPYALIEAAVIRDPNGKIKAVKHYPSFANAIVLLVEHTKTLGSALQIVHYLAGAEIIHPGDWERIADQYGGFYNALLSIQDVIDRNLTKTSMGAKQFLVFADAIVTIIKDRRVAQAVKDRAEAKKHDKVQFVRDRGHDRDRDSDVEMLSVSAIHPSKCKAADVSPIFQGEDMAAILDRLDILAIDVAVLQSGAEDASYRPGTAFVLSLLKSVDALLEMGGKASKEMLKEYSEVLEQTTCQQLFNLDIISQACKQLIDRRETVRILLNNQDLEKTGILIRDLQVSKEHLGSSKSNTDAFETLVAGPSGSKSDPVAMAIEETL